MARFEVHPLGGGFAVTWSPKVQVDDESLDVLVELELDVEDGRLVVTRFTAQRRPKGPPVTIDVLKSLPLVRLTSQAAKDGLLYGLIRVESTGGAGTRVQPVDLHGLPEAERAAIVYRAAHFLGMPPTAAVAEVLGISRDMAAKRVQAARSAGLLEQTTKGRKGT